MRIQVMYFDGCPRWQTAVERLRAALVATDAAEARIELVDVESADQATGTGFAGSPTILINGRDLFPGATPVAELTCRLYTTPDGLRGSPLPEAFTAALSGLVIR